MADIVRILQQLAEANSIQYHYGKRASLNLIQPAELDLTQPVVYMLHEFTNRKSEYNDSGTRIIAGTYEGKFFLVKHSNYDQQYFKERGQEASSKYTQNIEPLLQIHSAIGNGLACSGHTVQQWDNIDVTDALDANMDGLLCSYRIRISI